VGKSSFADGACGGHGTSILILFAPLPQVKCWSPLWNSCRKANKPVESSASSVENSPPGGKSKAQVIGFAIQETKSRKAAVGWRIYKVVGSVKGRLRDGIAEGARY
jgi:hypothetical protein